MRRVDLDRAWTRARPRTQKAGETGGRGWGGGRLLLAPLGCRASARRLWSGRQGLSLATGYWRPTAGLAEARARARSAEPLRQPQATRAARRCAYPAAAGGRTTGVGAGRGRGAGRAGPLFRN